jgi:LPXTG-motif cell wall-anchored protein
MHRWFGPALALVATTLCVVGYAGSGPGLVRGAQQLLSPGAQPSNLLVLGAALVIGGLAWKRRRRK